MSAFPPLLDAKRTSRIEGKNRANDPERHWLQCRAVLAFDVQARVSRDAVAPMRTSCRD